MQRPGLTSHCINVCVVLFYVIDLCSGNILVFFYSLLPMHTKYISETFGFILSLISFRQIDPVPSPCVDGDVHPRRREALIQIKVSVPLQIPPFHSPGPHPSTKVDQGSLRCSQVLFRRVKYLWTSPPPSAVKASHGGPNAV